MAQQLQQQQQTTTTTTAPPSSLSITTTPPLTPEEQAQQNRLQNVIAATTRDLNETEKQVSGIVYTPRWSEPVWVNPNSIAVLVAYCLPGEFADSGQEILGGFELEVLESYAIDLPQGFMAWMAVVGNEDVQNRRFPAALGVICASDLNNTDTRILSPQEQQEINNINQQFVNIQNTQLTNIDQVINIINNVTTPTQNETGGGMTPQPPANDTGPTEEQLPKVKANVYPTVAFVTPDRPAEIVFDADATGGTPPYEYFWSGTYFGGGFVEDKSFTLQFTEPVDYYFRITIYDSKGYYAYEDVRVRVLRGEEEAAAPQPTNDTGAASASATEPPLIAEIIANATQAFAPATIRLDANITGGAPPYSYIWSDPNLGLIDQDRSITLNFFEPGTFTYTLTVTDSRGKVVTDNVQILISERRLPPTEGIVAPEPGGIAPPQEEGGLLPSTPPPPNDNEVISPPEGGGAQSTSPTTDEGEEPSPPPPATDDTGGEAGQESPPSDEEPTTPPDGG